jgi:hypothetical protein
VAEAFLDGMTSLRPSTRSLALAAQDEEIFFMPSNMRLILSRAEGASRRTHHCLGHHREPSAPWFDF